QEEKYRNGQRSEDTRDGKGKVLAKADQRTRSQYKEIKNMKKFGKQDRKRWEEQGRKTIIESEKINTLQRRPIGKWKERTREETKEENTVLSSQKLLEKILKRLVRLEERNSIGVTPCHS
ncbi:6976_t:CDS:1, partial [Gigaspora rosea]